MLKTSIIWLDVVVEKIAWKHNVVRHEVHELFEHRPHVRFIERGNYRGEDVYAAYGQTASGRYLVVFFISKQNRQVLPLSARDMTAKERNYYEKT